MPSQLKYRKRPEPWKVKGGTRPYWAWPILFVDWMCEYLAYFLGLISFFDLLEYAGSLSLLVGVIFYFREAPQRAEQKHYQAWQVINTAMNQTGSGGRIDALQDLNRDHVSLVGVNCSNAYLEGVDLWGANLRRASFIACDLRESHFEEATLETASFRAANLRGASLDGADLIAVTFSGCDMTGASMKGVNLKYSSLDGADLTNVDLAGVTDWGDITVMKGANIHNIKNAPAGFVAFAKSKGAVDH